MHDYKSNGFDFDGALQQINGAGFKWHQFKDVFPFGFLGIREGQYYELVKAAALSLPTDKERSLLIDMLDMQWATYLEQLWVANDFGGDKHRFAGQCHFADARIQIDNKIRDELDLEPRSVRSALLDQDENWTHLEALLAGLAALRAAR
ncbi:hypothetical protein [Altererythrobacter litoralis]|uniref:Uncharacterized protein n=1 Tax=Altererythrobacter litoralis TaxID=3113904 RepID=A0ABU7GFT1_9SPHN|nr:hypothetical protein [Erythrobacteraceae bacterium 1XM1-14]